VRFDVFYELTHIQIANAQGKLNVKEKRTDHFTRSYSSSSAMAMPYIPAARDAFIT